MTGKGDKYERQAADWVTEWGGAVMRAPASGSATERELPDLFIGFGDVAIAGEHKYSSGDPIYVSKEEVRDLRWFASKYPDVEAVIITRWARDVTWYVHRIEDLHETNKSYRIREENREKTSFATLEQMASVPYEPSNGT